MSNQDRVLSLMGLAARSRNIVSGEFATENAVKSGNAWLVILPEDASDNTKKRFRNMCEFRGVPCYEYGTKAVLGHAIGKEERASCAITNEGFAVQIEKYFEGMNVDRR